MNRRTFLATTGSGFGLAGGYLGWRWYRSSPSPAELDVETLYVDRDVSTTDFSREGESMSYGEEYHTVVDDSATAERELDDAESVTEFVSDTDFDESYLVVVQNGMQSEPDLVLDSVRRTDNGITIDVSIDAPRAVDDDLSIHSLLIRVADAGDGLPETVAVDIDGYV